MNFEKTFKVLVFLGYPVCAQYLRDLKASHEELMNKGLAAIDKYTANGLPGPQMRDLYDVIKAAEALR